MTGRRVTGGATQVLRMEYPRNMRSISQRELRNNSAEIMRGLARGESYRVTNRGVPVGVLRAEGRSALDELILRPGSQAMQFPPGVRRAVSTGNALDELRRDR